MRDRRCPICSARAVPVSGDDIGPHFEALTVSGPPDDCRSMRECACPRALTNFGCPTNLSQAVELARANGLTLIALLHGQRVVV